MLWAGEAAAKQRFQLRYIVASCMYGDLPLATILPEVRRAGASCLDLWPRPHATQREQAEAMGHDRFADLLQRHRISLGMITRYDLGPFGLAKEMPFARQHGARLIVTGSRGPATAQGADLRAAVKQFVEKMKPHLEVAAEAGVTIGIENHGHALIHSPESLRYLAEFEKTGRMGIALAPYHLPQDSALIAALIKDLGPKLVHFYAWQHGQGAMKKLPKDQEMLQMPGLGPLDFGPIIQALQRIDYQGWTSIFMHPVPRGIPILPSAREVTAAINAARKYLDPLAGLSR
jgi:sugar phosphate isomerase/epimerase